MSDIASNLSFLASQIPSSVKLIAVSKTKPVSDILEAYNSGQKYFGENRVQELLSKKDELPSDIEWHLIGHLQNNKAKYIVSFVAMIHSVDSFKLLNTLNTEALKAGRIVDCLLQIRIAAEETKYGFSFEDLHENFGNENFHDLKNIRICGVMGMATFTSDTDQIKKEFVYLRNCFNSLKNRYFNSDEYFSEISMGMSGDYEIALMEGTTMVRIGSLIFGKRINIA